MQSVIAIFAVETMVGNESAIVPSKSKIMSELDSADLKLPQKLPALYLHPVMFCVIAMSNQSSTYV